MHKARWGEVNALDLDIEFRKGIEDSVNKASGLPYKLYVSILYCPIDYCYDILLYDKTIDFYFKQYLYAKDVKYGDVYNRIYLLNEIIRGFIDMVNEMNFYTGDV